MAGEKIILCWIDEKMRRNGNKRMGKEYAMARGLENLR